MKSNKKRGNEFEQELAMILSANDMWVHVFQQNSDGQPADIIACNKQHSFLIDAKVCLNSFSTDRIEDNQELAMYIWLQRVGTMPYFAIKFEKTGNIYMVDYVWLSTSKKKNLSEEDIAYMGKTLEEWVNDL